MQRTIVGIDVGSTKVCTVVAQVADNGKMNILGIGMAPGKGLDKGVVVDLDDAINAITTSVEKAERLSGYRIGSAYVGIAGRHISSLNSRGVVAVSSPDHEITRADIDRAVESAQAVTIPTQREIVHVIPRAYVVDGNEGIRDPVGMSGFRLEVETHIVTGEVMAIQNLIKSVQKSGVEIEDLVLQPLAAGEAVLTDEDKDRGVMLVDIGGGTTDIAIFAQGGVWHTGVVPIGGSHFTNDLVYVLRTPPNTAEYLKLRYGSAIASEITSEEEDRIEADTLIIGEKQQISRHELHEIINARAYELVELIYNESRRSGYEGHLPAGIVLTGGTAMLPRLDELVREMLGMPCRVGVPRNLTGLADSLDTPSYATGVGLIRWGARHGITEPQQQRRRGRGDPSQPSFSERFRKWLREYIP